MPLRLNPRARRRSAGRAAPTSRRAAVPSVGGCAGCFSDAVACVEQHERGGSRRLLLVRCGECGAWRRALVSVAAAELFERHLNTGRAGRDGPIGSPNNDHLDGGLRLDSCLADAGDDGVHADDRETDHVDRGAGRDTAGRDADEQGGFPCEPR